MIDESLRILSRTRVLQLGVLSGPQKEIFKKLDEAAERGLTLTDLKAEAIYAENTIRKALSEMRPKLAAFFGPEGAGCDLTAICEIPTLTQGAHKEQRYLLVWSLRPPENQGDDIKRKATIETSALDREKERSRIWSVLSEAQAIVSEDSACLLRDGPAWLASANRCLGLVDALPFDFSNVEARSFFIKKRISALRERQFQLSRWTGARSDLGNRVVALSHHRCTPFPQSLFRDALAHNNDIVIGSIFQTFTHLHSVRAIQLAIEEINQLEGIKGRRFGLASCTTNEESSFDNLTPTEATGEVARYLVNTLNVPIIIGADSSTRTQIAYKAIEHTGTLLISPSATSHHLKEIDRALLSNHKPSLLWRSIAPDSFQAKAMADLLLNVEGRCAILSEQSAYGDGLAEGIAAELLQTAAGRRDNFQFLTYRGAYERSRRIKLLLSTESIKAIALVTSSHEDFLSLLALFSDCVAANPHRTTSLFLPDSAYDTSLYADLPLEHPAPPCIIGTRPATSSTKCLEDFVNRYDNRFGEESPPSHVRDSAYIANAYDAAWVVFYGAAWSLQKYGAIFGLGIAEGLRNLNCPGADVVSVGPSDWSKGTELITRNSSGFDLEGASGPLDFDPETGEVSARIETWTVRISDGRWQIADQTVDTVT
jgi:branched-chain amino acid transport system substrate-binding protein